MGILRGAVAGWSSLFKYLGYQVDQKIEDIKNGKRMEEVKEIVETENLMVLSLMKKAKNLKTYLKHLTRWYCLNSILVADKKGNLVVSTNNNGVETSKNVVKLLDYASRTKLVSGSKCLMIKDEDWKMALPGADGKIYIFESPIELSPMELKLIANDVSRAFGRFGEGS